MITILIVLMLSSLTAPTTSSSLSLLLDLDNATESSRWNSEGSMRSALSTSYDFLHMNVMETSETRNPDLPVDLVDALSRMASIDDPDWIDSFLNDMLSAWRRPSPAVVIGVSQQLFDMLDVAVAAVQAQGRHDVVLGAALGAARFVVLALSLAPAAVRDAIENRTTFIHLLLSEPLGVHASIVTGLRGLVPATSMNVLSHVDPEGQTPLHRALRLIPWAKDLHHLMISGMTGCALVHTWRQSLSPSTFTTWIGVFDAYNHAVLNRLQYDVDRFTSELCLTEPALCERLQRSLIVRTLWRCPQAKRCLSVYVLVFRSGDPAILGLYDVSSEDQLLRRLFPESVTNDAQRHFLQIALRYLRDPCRPGLDHVIEELSQWSLMDVPLMPLSICCHELSIQPRKSPYLQLAVSLCEHQLRHHVLLFPMPIVLPHIAFLMEIVQSCMPEPMAFWKLSLEMQLKLMIAVSNDLPETPLRANLVIIVAALICELAETQIDLALIVLCPLISQRSAFLVRDTHPFIFNAVDKVVDQLRRCSTQLVDIYQRMALILLNNLLVLDSTLMEMNSPLHPGPLFQMLTVLLRMVTPDMLPQIYLQCPESPIDHHLFPLHDNLFQKSVLQHLIDRTFATGSHPGLRLAEAKDLDDDRHGICSICTQENGVQEQRQHQRQIRRRMSSVITPCNHCFHGTCLKIWLLEHLSCPTCRATIHIPSYRCQMPELTISELELVATLSRLRTQ